MHVMRQQRHIGNMSLEELQDYRGHHSDQEWQQIDNMSETER